MRHPHLPALVLLCLGLAATTSPASELRLRWESCSGDGGAYNETFACGDAIGGPVLVGSFVLDQTVTELVGMDVVIDITSLGDALPAWWDHTAAGCRHTALSTSFTRPIGAAACADRYHGTAAGGIAAYRTFSTPVPTPAPNMARLVLALAVPDQRAFTAEAGQEIFAFQLQFEHAPWTGSPECGGCGVPVCLAWGQGNFYRASSEIVRVIGAGTPANGSNVTWQPGAVATTVGDCPPNHICSSAVYCASVTPTRAPTWGRIKAMFR